MEHEPEQVEGVQIFFVTRRTSGAGRRMESVLARLQLQRRELRVFTVDADSHPELIHALQIAQIPSIAVVTNGQVSARLSGRVAFRDIEAALVSPE
jgi:thioredoxin-like negative regulator of GroEL